jgi:hypothetical protein
MQAEFRRPAWYILLTVLYLTVRPVFGHHSDSLEFPSGSFHQRAAFVAGSFPVPS